MVQQMLPLHGGGYISVIAMAGRGSVRIGRGRTSTREGVPFRQVEIDSLFFLNNGRLLQ
jgi:hypothetical protein